MPQNGFFSVSPAGFYLLRTPALPSEVFTCWNDSAQFKQDYDTSQPKERESIWHKHVEVLRARLGDIVRLPEVAQAIYLASPSLHDSIAAWESDPESKKGRQTERALVRYLARMSGRATPFGLFSGTTLGTVRPNDSDLSAILLKPWPYHRTHTRLDYGYLFSLAQTMQQHKEIADNCQYTANSSLYKYGEFWHYLEPKVSKDWLSCEYELIKLATDPVLDSVLERTQNSAAGFDELLSVLRTCEPTVGWAEASDYFRLLVENKILISSLSPPVIGPLPIDRLITELQATTEGQQFASRLLLVQQKLHQIDDTGLGASVGQYKDVVKLLDQLPAKFEPDRVLQVDLVKVADQNSVSAKVAAAITHAAEILGRFSFPEEPEPITRFREAFLNRYEHAFVPLLEALDEEIGIGFDFRGAVESTATRGLNLKRASAPERRVLDTPLDSILYEQVFECVRDRKVEVQMSSSQIPILEKKYRSAPSSFCLNVEIVAESVAALNAGSFRILWNTSYGPDGARTLARFCHVDPDLAAAVRAYLRREDSQNPDCIYADVVHLPEGRVGNVLLRPSLRDFEILYHGHSGTEEGTKIPASSILVTVNADGEICLFSEKLAARIIPRLTTAHSFLNPRNTPVYRFLGYLQHQHGAAAPRFSWGPLANLPYLPRLVVDNVVLAVARWRIEKHEIQELHSRVGYERFDGMQRLRTARSLPRFVQLENSDLTLLTDLDNPLSVDAMIHVLAREQNAILREVYPLPGGLLVESPEGHFWHEIDFPFVANSLESVTAASPQKSTRARPRIEPVTEERVFAPGSAWLSAKLYGASVSLDKVLREYIQTTLSHAREKDLLLQWFFIRFADPDVHLRIRFRAKTPVRYIELLGFITAQLEPLVSQRAIWKLQLDTYVRETERYGGPDAMLVAERIFEIDSQAVVEILNLMPGDNDSDLRWRAAFLGLDALFSAFDLAPEESLEVVRDLRNSYFTSFQVTDSVRHNLSERFRTERRALELIRNREVGGSRFWASAFRILELRTARLRREADAFRNFESHSRISVPIPELVKSFAHMHVNRIMRAGANEHEVILYDFLFRIYDSELKRHSRNQKQAVLH
jgi:lantibiotic biosynthesis protein